MEPTKSDRVREAIEKKMLLKYEFFPKGGLDQTKSFEALFFASKPPKGGGDWLTICTCAFFAAITRIGIKSLLENTLMFKEVFFFGLLSDQGSIAGEDGIDLQKVG